MEGCLPIAQIPAALCRELRRFFSDIDDTLTTGGLLTPESFAGLWQLQGAGIEVVVVTGRPAGWCDHIARMWPVAAVVGENGAFYYAYDRSQRRMQRRYLIEERERLEGRRRLERLRERVLREVPRCRIAADQPFRLTDLAFDFCEDVVPPLEEAEVERICRIAADEGASWKISSIHVNCWYGRFDKVSGVRRFLADRGWELDSREVQGSSTFIGDSPNDEPLFAALEHSIAVANLRTFLGRLQHLPAYITHAEAAAGFSEAVRTILGRRADGEAETSASQPRGPTPSGG
jgi:HAD superfamily hydrolase (TIGR01484 family)